MNNDLRLRSLLLWGLAGFLILQFYVILQNTFQYVSIRDLDNVSEQVQSQRFENEALKTQYNQLKEQLAGIYEQMDQGVSREDILTAERDLYKSLAGHTAVQGEGVVIIITDSDSPLYENDDPNKLIVHDHDVQSILSDLRNSGAEAISINDQRVVFGRTKVYCNGPTIRVDENYYSQPFVIKAIGSRKELQAAINSNQAHAFKMRQRGIFIEANTSIYVDMPAYTQVSSTQYIQEE